MDKKLIIGVGVLIIIPIAIFLYFNGADANTEPNTSPDTNYDDSVRLNLIVQGETGDSIKLNDKKIHIMAGLASYDPSKIGSCPYANIKIDGCGVNYEGATDDGGFATIPVYFAEKGTLTITCKYKNYEKTIYLRVE
ncbi:hypothetical protein [Methanococcus aeolicus]|uniref:Uncharacterized protein n=1 Tax=Methanococcus aeolicus (strain ATCC BAA-1280 / DSM 17508 / OCM 812 / Nankai-3) TaxID=419665 RepID=A6UTK7_META3|nr:hypothetical protein [Methanococcus aeolicus]ABR55829.1 hypothetical protein Maeo_0239 [Methanococcus aeolicus Nankai-3]UXM84063.1 hypothetical protein N6C89_04670 [Methanococcus aeolicus]